MAGGGRPACSEARHFTHLKELGEAGGCYSFQECSFCRAAFNNDITTTSPKVIIGRARNYVNHLAKYKYYHAAQLPPASTSSSPAP
ncbi:hypothetical protein PC116_g18402 [Phytophthora cactorum]|nr:hypothetical protein Pcac1_g8650 [Phytophthora cactorum]KAG3156909.1 hypothetical protein C6341_g14908 [Phytophthora cactorum]KAG3179431.1 hypothetical protein PC128_g15961 [Phytophthora cactorum]KAG4233408.1 hypothetical protein PC116_g18402 [Phytophthora cactorum]